MELDKARDFVRENRRGVLATHRAGGGIRQSPIIGERFFGPWISAEGDAEIVSLPEAMEPLIDYHRRFGGEEPDWSEYRGRMERERRVPIRITIATAGPDRTG